MALISKSKIDRAGANLSRDIMDVADEEILESELIFDEHRARHLRPLSETTTELQHWLSEFSSSYYLAQRLKRKPQILRKLKRFSVRLSQLQDIGGCRIIVEDNAAVERLKTYISDRVAAGKSIRLVKVTDYRPWGRDDTGYRAVHFILERDGVTLELQLRSKVQHYWAESIERTSVIYGRRLKEREGDGRVIRYFKVLSDIFYMFEHGHEPLADTQQELETLRAESEKIIATVSGGRQMYGHVDEGIVKTLTEKEARGSAGLNNWIMVFDWNTGSFVTWDSVSRDPDEAVRIYTDYENQFPETGNFEVVLIGSSDIATVRQTHSHYFGVSSYQKVLDDLQDSLQDVSRNLDLDFGSRQILAVLVRKKYWGKKSILSSTLKNHHCSKVRSFDTSLAELVRRGYVREHASLGEVSLNVKCKNEIEFYL